jgi:hypothetical protein
MLEAVVLVRIDDMDKLETVQQWSARFELAESGDLDLVQRAIDQAHEERERS